MRELSIFIDESGDFGPYQAHSPVYILSIVLHDQSDDISSHLARLHEGLSHLGLPAAHAVHAGPLIRREHDYVSLDMPTRRSIFRLLVEFLHRCDVTHHSWVFNKRELDSDQLVSRMAREVGALISDQLAFFSRWDRIVIYYDNGQKEITNLVNSVFSALLSNVEVRKVVPSDYSLFQVADLCCTLALVRHKLETSSLSSSEDNFFSTQRDNAARALKKGYFKTLDRKTFGP